jgi:hypothetical protein
VACKGFYFGGQIFMRHDQYTAYISYKEGLSDSTEIIRNPIGVYRNCIGVNAIFGFERKLFWKSYIDAFIGPGAMIRNIENPDRDYSKDNLLYSGGTDLVPFFNKQNLSESSGTSVSITLGLRLGIAF